MSGDLTCCRVSSPDVEPDPHAKQAATPQQENCALERGADDCCACRQRAEPCAPPCSALVMQARHGEMSALREDRMTPLAQVERPEPTPPPLDAAAQLGARRGRAMRTSSLW